MSQLVLTAAGGDLDNTVSLDLEPERSPGAVDVVVAVEAAPIGLMEPLETPRIRASESRSFSRFHDAPQALFGLF